MINIQNLKFTYPMAQQATLIIPQIEIKTGEMVFIHGPSGCGKTTFLESLAGVLQPQQGQIFLNGTDIVGLNQKQKDQFRSDNMGYIFQNFNLIPYLSVKENISLPLYLSPAKREQVPLSKENETVEAMVKKLGLTPFIHRKVTDLSVGQQQRVAAARALIGMPRLLLADEPTSSLDYDHREKFIQLLFEIASTANTTLLFVSHDRQLEKLFHRSISLPDVNQANFNFEGNP